MRAGGRADSPIEPAISELIEIEWMKLSFSSKVRMSPTGDRARMKLFPLGPIWLSNWNRTYQSSLSHFLKEFLSFLFSRRIPLWCTPVPFPFLFSLPGYFPFHSLRCVIRRLMRWVGPIKSTTVVFRSFLWELVTAVFSLPSWSLHHKFADKPHCELTLARNARIIIL